MVHPAESTNLDMSKGSHCDSCAIVRACAHFGISAYLITCCNAKQTRFSRFFILSFAAGNNQFNLPFYLYPIHHKRAQRHKSDWRQAEWTIIWLIQINIADLTKPNLSFLFPSPNPSIDAEFQILTWIDSCQHVRVRSLRF